MPPYRTGFICNQDEDYPRAAQKVQFTTENQPIHIQPQLHVAANTYNQSTMNIMDAAVSEKTLHRKSQYAAEFLVWAGEQGLQEINVLPPSVATLCNFAASFAGKLAGGTTKAKLSTVKSWVQKRGLAWNGQDNLRNMLNGIKHRAPSSSFRDQRPPIKKEHLSILFDKLDLTGTCGINHAIAAASTGCFYGQLRGSKILLLSSDTNDYNPNSLPTIKDLGPANENGNRKLRLLKTKVEQTRGKEVIYSPQPGPNDPLLGYQNDSGELKVLTKLIFLKLCKQIWSEHGIPRMTGHCFRIGGTTHYLIQGIAPDIVKIPGCWKSDVFLKYWRDLESLASIHLH
ncbi:hypothetical protein BT96DRAFT_990411 [Gymnopus androsaceus JB14]|uniref:DNA breaking-rejoining enzyme n=1 Tax=Gymnopus androsaceus JB14 TaxID=1447944 RepID=A0A6A4HZA8_9AGAR|nr:hypothetical protein BT96DRAFT_990411 [Gymnopus androsaceus JB14]